MSFSALRYLRPRGDLASRRSVFKISQHAYSTTTDQRVNPLKRYVSLAAFVASGTFLTIYYMDSRSAIHRYVTMPLVRISLDPENGHVFAVKLLASGLGPQDLGTDEISLSTELWGRTLHNPIGIAAGFDKNGEAINGLYNLGFSWVEVGSVTPRPQDGNEKPRVFHLEDDGAIINRYGFPSQGHAIVLSRLRSYLSAHPPSASSQSILAVNLGKNKTSAPDSTSDFITGVTTFGPFADVLVVNVSSPNTPGLRGLQGRGALEELLSEVVKTRNALPERNSAEWKWSKAKIVVKIAPDLSHQEIQDIAEAVKGSGIDGVIVSNTTIQRPASLKSINAIEGGGLSGLPLQSLSLHAVQALRSLLLPSTPIIGCGGIATGQDALLFAKSGATLVQLYTSFSYDGPGTPRRIKDELGFALESERTTWKATVSEAVKANSLKQQSPGEILRKQAEEMKAVVAQSVDLPDITPSRLSIGKTVQDLIKEAERALGISP